MLYANQLKCATLYALFYVGQRAAAPSPTTPTPRPGATASASPNLRPRQRLPAVPRSASVPLRTSGPQQTQPRVIRSTSATSAAITLPPRVPVVRPSIPGGTRPIRPSPGIARQAASAQNVVSEPVIGGVSPGSNDNSFLVPRRAMAPSRIAAIMLRCQFSNDRVWLIEPNIFIPYCSQKLDYNAIDKVC